MERELLRDPPNKLSVACPSSDAASKLTGENAAQGSIPPSRMQTVLSSGTGQRAAQDAAEQWLAEGRRVRIALPPEPGADMADALVADTAANTMEGRHVA
jgi:hypothetical protein